MSLIQTSHSSEQTQARSARHPWLRLALLCALLLMAIGFNVALLVTAPPIDTYVAPFVALWLVSFVPYIAACLLVLLTRPLTGRQRWIELGVILVGGVVLRALLLPVPPNLSHDSWRYLWDARVTLHGYSPYVYGPGTPIFTPLRDFVYSNSRFRAVPTIYPPAAQGIYLLSYLVAPSNLGVLKGIFVGFDTITSVALAFLLYRKGLDPCRCLLYAWCPLPIIEFAIQGHLDASTIAFSVLALLVASMQWRGSRVLTGVLIALATLTKLYPILLLVAVVKRRDWMLLLACFTTIVLGYIPYLILGHGEVLGFFKSYASEQTQNAGVVQLVVLWLAGLFGLAVPIAALLVYLCDLLLVGSVTLIILRMRWQSSMRMESAALLLFVAIFAASSHIFPWYTAALLPWVALLVEPLRTPQGSLNARGLVFIMAWYFACASIIAYFFANSPDWRLYYLLVYTLPLVGVAVATWLAVFSRRASKRQVKV